MFCGFSAQVAIGELYQQIQTVLLTSITPVILGIFDQVLIERILYSRPSLYKYAVDTVFEYFIMSYYSILSVLSYSLCRTSQSSFYYNRYSFWLYSLEAIYQSVVVFFIGYAVCLIL